MAKSSNRGAGPGTYSSGGVRCTLDPPWTNGSNKGNAGQSLPSPFNAPRPSGELPTHIYDPMGGPTSTASASSGRDSLGTIATNPNSNRRMRGGNTRG